MKGNHSWPHTTSSWCFTGRGPHPGDIPWTAFLSYPNSSAPLPSLDLQPVSVSPSGKPRLAFLLQSRSRCQWLPISTPSPPASGPLGQSSQAPAAMVGSPLHFIGTSSKGTSNSVPYPGLDLNKSCYTKTTAQEAFETLTAHFQAHCFWTCVKKSHYFTSPEKKVHCCLWHLPPHFFHTFLWACGGGGGICCCYWDARDYATV